MTRMNLNDWWQENKRFAVIVESAERCTLKNLDTGEQTPDVALAEVGRRIHR